MRPPRDQKRFVRTPHDDVVSPSHSVDPAEVDPVSWREKFDELMARVAKRFGRVEPRRRARAFVEGLLSDLPRKNCWTIAVRHDAA